MAGASPLAKEARSSLRCKGEQCRVVLSERAERENWWESVESVDEKHPPPGNGKVDREAVDDGKNRCRPGQRTRSVLRVSMSLRSRFKSRTKTSPSHYSTFRNYAALVKEFAGEGSPTRREEDRGAGDDAPLQVSFFVFSFSRPVVLLVPAVLESSFWNRRRERDREISSRVLWRGDGKGAEAFQYRHRRKRHGEKETLDAFDDGGDKPRLPLLR